MLSVYSQLPFVLLVTLFILGCTDDSSVAFDVSSEQISDKLAKQAKSGRYVFEDGLFTKVSWFLDYQMDME